MRQAVKEATRPADGLSILALASSIAALVLMLFSIMPLLALCLGPLSVLSAAVAVVSALASLVRTTLKPELDGRWQALAALTLMTVWGAGAWILFSVVSRH